MSAAHRRSVSVPQVSSVPSSPARSQTAAGGDARRRLRQDERVAGALPSRASQTIRRADSLLIRQYLELHSSYTAIVALATLFVALLAVANMPVFVPLLRDALAPLSYSFFRLAANAAAAVLGLLLLRGVYCYLRPPPSLHHLSASERVLLGLPPAAPPPSSFSATSLSSSSSSSTSSPVFSFDPRAPADRQSRVFTPPAALPVRSLGPTSPASSSRSRPARSGSASFAPQLVGRSPRPKTSPYESISPSGGLDIRDQHSLQQFLDDSLMPRATGGSSIKRAAASDFDVRSTSAYYEGERPSMKWLAYRSSIAKPKAASLQTDKFGPANREAAAIIERLGITKTMLDVWMDRMRLWLSATIVCPLIACFDSCDKGVPVIPAPCANPTRYIFDQAQLLTNFGRQSGQQTVITENLKNVPERLSMGEQPVAVRRADNHAPVLHLHGHFAAHRPSVPQAVHAPALHGRRQDRVAQPGHRHSRGADRALALRNRDASQERRDVGDGRRRRAAAEQRQRGRRGRERAGLFQLRVEQEGPAQAVRHRERQPRQLEADGLGGVAVLSRPPQRLPGARHVHLFH